MPECKCVLVGNKSEAVDEIRITAEVGEKQAAAWNVKSFSVSAKSGSDIKKLTQYIVNNLR